MDERKFLHDISSPIGAALLYVEAMEEDIQKSLPEVLPTVIKTKDLLKRIQTLLQERRQYLQSKGSNEAA